MQIGNGKGLLHQIETALEAYLAAFGGTYDEAATTLQVVLTKWRHVKPPRRKRGDVEALDDDVILDCELCTPEWEWWWQENYGVFWQAARWWHCGPLGLECPGFE